jgi:hypothetical protein
MCVAWRGLKWSGPRMEINHRGSFTETIAALHGDRCSKLDAEPSRR